MESRYKKYLIHGDAAIPVRTAQRYNLNHNTPETHNEEYILTGENDFMDVEQENIINCEVQLPAFLEDNDNVQDEISDSTEFYWISELYKLMLNNDLNNIHNKNKNLNEFLESEDLFQIITTPVDKNKGEIFLMILKFSLANKLSFTGLINLLKLVNSMFKRPILPDSRYIIDKLLNPKQGVQYHAVCHNCSVYIGKFGKIPSSTICNICNTEINLENSSDSTFFTLIDPSQQIADLVSSHQDYFNFVTNERSRRPGYISDVYDGKQYTAFLKSLPNEEKSNYVTAVFNTDGAQKFKCSQYSVWPLYLMINELPKEIRTKKLVICGLMFTNKKPDMTVFLDKFVDLINTCQIPVVIANENRLLKLYILSCCVDAVARAPIQGLTQYNGKFGCNWCLHPGEYHGIIKYPLTNSTIQLRNHKDTVALMLNADSENPVFGIKFPSPLINLSQFDIIEGFTPDYMHMALEGVAKQFTSYHLDKLHEICITALDTITQRIAVPQQISRYCRPLSCRKDWKAREWENFVLYYSIVIFPIILNTKTLEHWLLFVEGLYILLKDNIHVDELNEADELLHRFVADIEEIYNVKAMTYNVHLLLHVSRSVLNWGPLWANSTFSFESANQRVLNASKCAKGVTHQLVRFVNISHSCSVIEDKVICNAKYDVVRYCNNILLRQVQQVHYSNSNILYFNRSEVNAEILHTLQLPRHSTEFFHKIVKDHCLYESHLITKTRSNNSFAYLKDGKFIRIFGFIDSVNDGIELTICNYVHTRNCFTRAYKACQVVRKIDDETVAIRTDTIEKVCVFMNIDDKMYIIPIPNVLHY